MTEFPTTFNIDVDVSGLNPSYVGAWATSTSYTEKTLVRPAAGHVYYCKTDHTSAGASEPGVGGSWTTYWALFLTDGAAGSFSSQTLGAGVGFSVTPYSAGTKSTGTYTPASTDGNFQYATNGGAHTLAPPSTACNILIEYTNNGSAGTITTSSFTKVKGDSLTTTNGHKFFLHITKHQNYSELVIQALQ